MRVAFGADCKFSSCSCQHCSRLVRCRHAKPITTPRKRAQVFSMLEIHDAKAHHAFFKAESPRMGHLSSGQHEGSW